MEILELINKLLPIISGASALLFIVLFYKLQNAILEKMDTRFAALEERLEDYIDKKFLAHQVEELKSKNDGISGLIAMVEENKRQLNGFGARLSDVEKKL